MLACLIIAYFYSAKPIIHHLINFQNVTITWYRLSRSKVYPSHTLLLTFLTLLNQERWTSATYIVDDIFYTVKSRTTVLNQEIQGRACGYAHVFLHKELIIIRFDSEVICIYASPNRFFCSTWRAFSCPRAAPTREAPRNAVCSIHGMCITFSRSRQAENLSPRGRTEEQHERASHF